MRDPALIREKFPVLAGRDVIVFDGACALCSGFMRFVVARDRQGHFHFATAQSALGEALYAALDARHGDYDTNLVLCDGRLHEKLDGFAEVMRRLGWPWRALVVLGLLPAGLKSWLYDRIARNRFALFARRDSCLVPDAGLRARFLDW